jgi:hypothetical protein
MILGRRECDLSLEVNNHRLGNKIIFFTNKVWGCGLYSTGPRYGSVAVSY